jgi:hypothetical protein
LSCFLISGRLFPADVRCDPACTGFHFREDFPERDDKNWLKWVIVKKEAGKMKLIAQPIPIHEYKVKPDNRQ